MRRNEPHCTRDYPTLVPKDYPDPPRETKPTQSDHAYLKESIIVVIRGLSGKIAMLLRDCWTCDYELLQSMTYEELSELRDELIEEYNQIIKGE